MRAEFPTFKQAVTTLRMTDENETMGSILNRLNDVNAKGEHILFDTSAIAIDKKLYLCSIFIDTEDGVVRLNDQVTGKQYIGVYDSTQTIGNVLSLAVDAYVSLQVEAVTRDGVLVTGQTVSLYEGSDEGGTLKGEMSYDGTPVVFLVPKGMEYFIKITSTLAGHFTPTTAHGIANTVKQITLEYDDVEHITTYAGIQAALAAIGDVTEAKNALVGKVINDTWVDFDATGVNGDATPARDAAGHPIWLDPMVVTDVKEVEDENGVTHIGAVMMRQYATRYTIPFDLGETEEATELTAQEGICYYGKVKDVANTYVRLTPYQNESTSGKSGFIVAGDTIPYSDYEKVYRNTVLDSGMNLMENNASNIIRYGHNRYEHSMWRKYLCADKDDAEGAWRTSSHAGQVPPTGDSYKYFPYQKGCSDALLAAIKRVKTAVMSNTKGDGGATYYVYDPFFLPCINEMFGTDNDGEGSYQYEYWWKTCGDTTKTLQPHNNKAEINNYRYRHAINGKTSPVGSGVTLRLRSAFRSYSYNAWFVSTAGYLNGGNGASVAFAGVPACVIY